MDRGLWHWTGCSDQDHLQEKQLQKGKMVVWGGLTNSCEKMQVKSKGEKEWYSHSNAEFQRIAKRDKKAFLSDQCKEIEENNRIGKTRDIFKKFRDTKGTFHAKMVSIKDRNFMDLTEAEDIKKRWQEYTEELYIEQFQILKNDTVKVLHSICQQIWKSQQWPQDWKRWVFIPIPKKGNAKECSNYHTIAHISHASKVTLKILQARLQQYVNCELPDAQAGFRKGRGTRDQIANIHWIMEKEREFQKNIYFCFID